MSCYTLYDENRKPCGHICGDLGPHCAVCGDVAANLCDYPVGDGKTCDRHLCKYCSSEIAPDVHYCAAHHAEWKAFRDAGGVKRELENVVPFKGA